MSGIPESGVIGTQALREAAKGSYQEIMERIRVAVEKATNKGTLPGFDVWSYVEALFPDTVVVGSKEGFTRYTWAVDENGKVTLGKPEKVEKVEGFLPAERRVQEASGGGVVAAEKRGTKFSVRVIQAGLSGNNVLYTETALREAVKGNLFEGVKVLVKADAVHLAGGGKEPGAVLGRLTEARYVDGTAAAPAAVMAVMDVLAAAGDMAARLAEAVERKLDLYGLSIDATATVRDARVDGRRIRIATAFRKIHTVDLIVDAGAGGAVVGLLEAQPDHDGDNAVNRETLLALLRDGGHLEGVADTDKLSAEQLQQRLAEALAGAEKGPATTTGLTEDAVQAMLDQRMKLVSLREAAVSQVAASNLPKPARDRVIATLREASGDALTDDAVTAAIKAEADYLRQTGSGWSDGSGVGSMRIEPGESRAEKIREALDAFFDQTHENHRHAQSIRQLYVDITGDANVTGNPKNMDQSRLREALDAASFGDVLGDSMTRRLLADYRMQTPVDAWRRICDVTRVADFRSQERTSWGGYGDIPQVAESGAYQPLASPTDDKAEYAVGKRGGTESVTLEMIKNDDVGVVRRLPIKMARAAKRTLSKFVFGFVIDNPVIYDGKAFFHADHGNLGVAALNRASLAAGRLAMMNQTEPGSEEPLWIGPKTLLVPGDQEEAAVDLFRRTTENDKNFIQSLTLDIVPVPWMADPSDWALVADPMDIPGIEIGFLDGQEEPELFVADNPRAGALFSSDQIVYKIRHIYGGAVCDYRCAYKSVVAD